MSRRLPEHLRTERGRKRLRELRRVATAFYGRYGAPVYLVGSALLDCNARPRDWDVRINLPDDDFTRMFGSVAAWEEQGNTGLWTDVRHHWSQECVKGSKEFYYRTGLNVDFQVYPETYALGVYRKRPRLRLDRGRP